MTVRIPLYWASDGFKPMTAAHVEQIQSRAIWLFGQNPSATLSYVAASGNLSAMEDTRFKAGVSVSRVDRFARADETPNIEEVSTTYDHISKGTASGTSYPADTNSIVYPTYIDGNDNIRSMTQQDFIDTFIEPAIIKLTTSGSSNAEKAGTYEILEAGATVPNALVRVSANPIFINTIADVDAFPAASALPDTVRDRPKTEETYYLYQYGISATAPAPTVRPMYLTNATNPMIQEYNNTKLDALLGPAIRHAATETGNKIVYAIEETSTASNRRGTMIDTRLSGLSSRGYLQRLLNIDAYITQEFPNGVETVLTTYYLTCKRA